MLDLQPFSDVYRVDRVRYLEGKPVVYVTHYIRPELFPNLLGHHLSHSLRATAGTPAMVVERINYNQHNELIDCDIEYWRHDVISIESCAELNR